MSGTINHLMCTTQSFILGMFLFLVAIDYLPNNVLSDNLLYADDSGFLSHSLDLDLLRAYVYQVNMLH